MSNSVNTSKNDSAIESKLKDSSNPNSLPLSRIRVIMKSLPDVKNITPEALFLVTKSTEMFIKYLTEKSMKHFTGKLMEYKHMALAIDAEEKLEFMSEIMPKKLTVKQVRERLEEESDSDDESGSESEEGEEEEEGDEEGEEEEEEEEDEVTEIKKPTKVDKNINDEDSDDCVVLTD